MYYKNLTNFLYIRNMYTFHTIFSGVADYISFNLGFIDLMSRDFKICKSDSLFTVPITEKNYI